MKTLEKLKIAASMSMGRPAYWHDLRISIAQNVNTELSKDNIVLIDEIKGRDIDEVIDEMMQPSIDNYNEKQKRKDRKINSTYTEWHRLNENKGEMIYEFVMQYGEHNDLGKMYYDATDPKEKERIRKQFEEVYTKWLEEWQKDHPNLKVMWATIHFDENGGTNQNNVGGTPHLHMAVTPISQEFKRGPQCQISMSKALEDDGIKRDATSKKEGYQLMRAFELFRKKQERDLIDLGYEIKEYKGGKHYDCDTYKELMQQAAQTLEDAERFREEAHEKAVKELSFAETASKIKDKAEKIIEEKGTEVIIDKNYKDSVFSKPREVAIVPLEIYESRSAAHNIKGAVQHLDLQFDRMEKIANKAIEEIESDGKAAAEKEIQELKQEVGKLKEEIKKKDNIIQYLTQKIDHMVEFIHQHNLLAMWQRLWRSIEDRFKKRDQEIEIKEREY